MIMTMMMVMVLFIYYSSFIDKSIL